MSACVACGRELTANEIGLFRKLVNRGAERFECIDCLALRFGVSADVLREKIEQFRRDGCTLFN